MRRNQLVYGVCLAISTSFAQGVMAKQSHADVPMSVNVVTTDEANSLSSALTQGSLKGLLRYNAHYRDTNLQVLSDSASPNSSASKKQQYSTIGGYLGYETAPWFHTSIGATLYSSNPVGHNPGSRSGLGGLYEKDGGQDSYAVMGEAYIKYQTDHHLIKIGRQELPDFRVVSTSDVRMSPITHEGVIYKNTAIDNLQLNFGYITQQKDRNAEEFNDMASSTRIKSGCGQLNDDGDCVDTGNKRLLRGHYDPMDFGADGQYIGSDKEMPMFGVIYNQDNFSVEFWDYHVEDLLNSIYVYGQYQLPNEGSDFTYTLAAQYGNQQDVGDHIAGDIDTWYYGLKVSAKSRSGLAFFASHNEVDYNEDSYDGGSIFVSWGSAQIFNSFQVQDSAWAGTKSYGAGVEYDFAQEGSFAGLYIRVRYAYHDMPDSLSDTDARQDRSETTLDVSYSFKNCLDGLKVRFRYAYNDYEMDYDFDAYSTRHGYTLSSITDDFDDIRLFVEYKF